MGWLGSYYGSKAPRGKERLAAILKSEGLDRETEHGKVVDAAIVGTTAYVAYYHKKLDLTIGFVLLSSYRRDDGYLMVKQMSESMGPCECDCPARILNRLSPLNDRIDPSGYAAGWRARCEENLMRGEPDNLGKLPIGTTIRVHNPQQTKLTVVKNRKGRRDYQGLGVRANARTIRSWGFDVLDMTTA